MLAEGPDCVDGKRNLIMWHNVGVHVITISTFQEFCELVYTVRNFLSYNKLL